jgi:hypothetical protein
MPKNKIKTAIYHPPNKGMPYLVVTVSPEGVNRTAVSSNDEARILASKTDQGEYECATDVRTLRSS